MYIIQIDLGNKKKRWRQYTFHSVAQAEDVIEWLCTYKSPYNYTFEEYREPKKSDIKFTDSYLYETFKEWRDNEAT